MRQSLFDYCKENNRSDLLAQWDNLKNLPLTPNNVTRGSSRKIWWICENGHHWAAAPYSRISQNSGCPVCAGKKIIPGENDLASLFPEIAAEWDTERNKNLSPKDISAYTHRKVWWKCCICGGEWMAVVKSRTGTGKVGCPYCANRAVQRGVNDLMTTHPDLAQQWNHEKNGSLAPQHVTAGSSAKVWWKCKKGHEWQAAIASRSRGSGCPICSGKRIIAGENDLQTLFPEIAKEWHSEKNNGLLPSEIAAQSNKSVWWCCDKGHEYKAVVSSRTGRETGCPYCSNKKMLVGFNDLATTHPDIAAEWHLTKNDILPTEVTSGSSKKVWWKCQERHEYQATICSRTSQHTGCPVCANKIIVAEDNSLKALFPTIAAEWHPTKNGLLKPSEISAGSNKRVWWQCEKGHEWMAQVSGRTVKKTACPVCMNKKVFVGFNDLATTHPQIAAQWHPILNGKLTPKMVTFGSNQRVWWKCEAGHIWKAPIVRRAGTQMSRCPVCYGKISRTSRLYYESVSELLEKQTSDGLADIAEKLELVLSKK